MPIMAILDTEWDESAIPSYECIEPIAFEIFYSWLGTARTARGMLLNPERYSPQALHEALTCSWTHSFVMDGDIPSEVSLPMAEQWEEDAEEGDIFESALPTPPASVAENIRRGTEAMKRVITTHQDENYAMYREELG